MPTIGSYMRLGPDLVTEWGTYPSPYVTGEAREYNPGVIASDIRGRHMFRTQPRDLSLIAPDPAAMERGILDVNMRTAGSLLPDQEIAHGVGATDPQAETRVALYLALGLGLFAAFVLLK